jgi:hypothetical protein
MTAPTSVMVIGVEMALTQNAIYNAPARAVAFLSSAVIEQSLDNSTYVAVTASTTGMTLIAPYIRCTGVTTCIAICKAY